MEKGKKPKKQSKEMVDGFLPYVDIKAFEKGIVDSYAFPEKCVLCNEGDLLIVCDGSRSGLTGRAIKGVVGSTLSKISADGLATEYLRYFIESKYTLLNTQKKGTGTPHLNTQILKQSKLIVPSLSEQERIVAQINELFSELDKAIAILKTIKQQLAVYRQAVLKEAFRDVTVKKTIRELSLFVTSGSRGWAKYYADTGARFIRISDLTRDSIALKNDSIQYVDLPNIAEGKRSRLIQGDVLVSITADLGSIALIPPDIGEAYVNQHIAMIRFKNAIQSEYMAWYLKSDYGQKDLLKNKRGGGKLGLGLDDIRDTYVPLIPDYVALKTVRKIEYQLGYCNQIEKAVDTALHQAKAIRQGILKKAFEGRL